MGIRDILESLPSSIVTKQTIPKDKSPCICTIDDMIVLQHNAFIQRRFFNGEGIHARSKPLYKWRKHPNKINLSKAEFTDGMMVERLDIRLDSVTGEHIKGVFHIIEFSYWTKKSVKAILSWIADNYTTMVDLKLRIIRLPEVTKNRKLVPGFVEIPPSKDLLCLGSSGKDSFKRKAGSINHKYFIWNGRNNAVGEALKHIRDTYLKTKPMLEVLGPLVDTYIREIGIIITMIESRGISVDETITEGKSVEEEYSTETSDDTDSTDSDSDTTDDTEESQPLTAESIVHRLGPDHARDLALSIIALTHRPN